VQLPPGMHAPLPRGGERGTHSGACTTNFSPPLIAEARLSANSPPAGNWVQPREWKAQASERAGADMLVYVRVGRAGKSFQTRVVQRQRPDAELLSRCACAPAAARLGRAGTAAKDALIRPCPCWRPPFQLLATPHHTTPCCPTNLDQPPARPRPPGPPKSPPARRHTQPAAWTPAPASSPLPPGPSPPCPAKQPTHLPRCARQTGCPQ
jgi:hypothetical protein